MALSDRAWTGPPGKADDGRLPELIHQLKVLERSPLGVSTLRSKRLELIGKIAEYETIAAAQFLVKLAENPDYVDMQEDLLRRIGERRPFQDFTFVRELFLQHMGPDDLCRGLAREWLLDVSKRRRDDSYPRRLFAEGATEDRFLALTVLGEIASPFAVELGAELLRDASWKSVPGGVVSCATIARSVARNEGPAAAQLLLLLRGDPRFAAADEQVLVEATRLWKKPDLENHIRLGALASPDPAERARMARFLGDAGIEAAREPLFLLLGRADEAPAVRSAVAEALGALRIARGDLASRLVPFLEDEDSSVRQGAVRGLARLEVRQAAEALVALLGGPLEAEVRASLARATGLPPGSDWRGWFEAGASDWPEGT